MLRIIYSVSFIPIGRKINRNRRGKKYQNTLNLIQRIISEMSDQRKLKTWYLTSEAIREKKTYILKKIKR